MRSAWTGTIQRGPLSIPVRLGAALPSSRATLTHRIHTVCNSRINQVTHCGACDADLPSGSAELGKGVELPDGGIVPISDSDLEDLRVWDNKVIKLLHFCPGSQVEWRLYDQTYYLEPTAGGGPAHRLLLEAMEEGQCAVCLIGYKDRSAPAILRPVDGVFMLTTLRWPAELRSVDVTHPPTQAPAANEVKMMRQYIKTLTRPFDPAEHTDTRSEAILQLAASKSGGAVPVPLRPADTAATYTGLMDLLKADIDKEKTRTAPKRRRTGTTAQAS